MIITTLLGPDKGGNRYFGNQHYYPDNWAALGEFSSVGKRPWHAKLLVGCDTVAADPR